MQATDGTQGDYATDKARVDLPTDGRRVDLPTDGRRVDYTTDLYRTRPLPTSRASNTLSTASADHPTPLAGSPRRAKVSPHLPTRPRLACLRVPYRR